MRTEAQRIAAAEDTARGTSNACAAIHPFYWELGDGSAALASGAVGGAAYGADTSMNIASASKWLYGAYVTEVRDGLFSDEDVKYLTFRSGYTSFRICLPGDTVSECADRLVNRAYNAADDGFFYYGGGHMQRHASTLGLGPLDDAALAAEMQRVLGSDIVLSYSQPQLAGGAVTTAADYARFLRKLLGGDLQVASALGTHAVCTNPSTCDAAHSTPIPTDESWHYSIGHWVEDDPLVGDGAFSSPGAFGFYPWIDAGKTIYGIIARKEGQGDDGAAESPAYVESVHCGRLIRKAWFAGVAQ